jgi:biopolymer transport protein ExbB
MFISIAAAAAGAAQDNPYGLEAALREGGIISQSVFTILVGMSIFSFYILFTKLIEQQKIISQGKKVKQSFWRSASLKEANAKLEKNTAYKQLVDDGLSAQEQHSKLTDPVEAHDWMHGSLARSEAAINSKLGGGLAFLATVGSTAPFIGLFGTVIGIYRALIKIGSSGQASIDKVAGPVGEALIMTALGLARRGARGARVTTGCSAATSRSPKTSTASRSICWVIMMSNGQVRPAVAAAPTAAARPAAAPAKA